MDPTLVSTLVSPYVEPDYLTPVYAAYAVASIALTVWLARVLGRNGRVFLDRVFPDDPTFAGSVNQLLVVGFYLVNFGFSCMHLVGGHATSVRGAVEVLAEKLGELLLVLAAMHFANLWVFNRIRKSAKPVRVEPPVSAQARVAAASSDDAGALAPATA